jgi:retron-type reverse transcriptase
MKIGLIQWGILSPILANIFMNVFDQWMEDIFIPSFITGKRRKKNPEYWKKYYQSNHKVKDKTIRLIMDKEPPFPASHNTGRYY